MTFALRFSKLLRAVDLWLVLAVALGGWLRFSRIGDFDNQYYTATVASMLRSPHNFLFASFDPGGVVMVDKPPSSFWVQAIFPSLFGMSKAAVNLPQAIAGTLTPLLLYLIMKPSFGRVAALAAALVFAVTPASIVVDSRNEPDSLLSLTLLLAALGIIKAAQTGPSLKGWPWLVAFALLTGFAFNIKMLVAFVPLPAFLLYYLLAARLSWRRLAVRTASTVALLLVVSFSWVSFVALTPAESRPYIGSTRDNSIWTLTFKYNGINRFTSFIGPRPPQQQPPPPGYQPQQPGLPPPISSGAADQGVIGLLANPLAAQLGWLLPIAVLMAMASLVPLLSERVYRRPVEIFTMFRESPASSQTVLWGGWFVTAMVVFGLADATTTHPYYLVGLAVPMAAVMGLGFATLWKAFQQGSCLSWVLPAALAGALAYQVYASRGQVADWGGAAVVAGGLLALVMMSVALWRKLGDTPLARASVALGSLSLLLIPALFGLHLGGQIAGPSPGPQPPPQGPRLNKEQQRITAISSFVRQQGDAGGVFLVATVNAREAAPFIIAGELALAIGGFSGGDPVFTVASFRERVERGELRYFLMPGPGAPGGQPGRPQQEPILSYIRSTWQDVSRGAGLPLGSLYRYQER